MRALLVCVVSFACASGSKEAAAPDPAATVLAESMPSNAPAPLSKSAPEAVVTATPSSADPVAAPPASPAAQPGGAMTAAEAAAALARQNHGGAGDAASAAASDEASCSGDDDCTLTRFSPGACCAMLCNPRAVTRKEAGALEAHARTCPMSHQCPQPACAPPRQTTDPACEKNRCVTRVRDGRSPA